MNIFYLDRSPEKAAIYHNNKHVVQLIRECRLELASAHPVEILEAFMFPTPRGYRHHPCSKWTRAGGDNYRYVARLGLALCSEYTYRYGKVHAYQPHLEWLAEHCPIDNDISTPVYLAMPDDCKHEDPVIAYRQYYLNYKQHLLTYTKREVPDWVKQFGLGVQK